MNSRGQCFFFSNSNRFPGFSEKSFSIFLLFVASSVLVTLVSVYPGQAQCSFIGDPVATYSHVLVIGLILFIFRFMTVNQGAGTVNWKLTHPGHQEPEPGSLSGPYISSQVSD